MVLYMYVPEYVCKHLKPYKFQELARCCAPLNHEQERDTP